MYKFSDFLDWDKDSLEETFNVSREFYEGLTKILAETTGLDPFDIKGMYKILLTSVNDNLEVKSVNEIAFVMYVVSEAIAIFRKLIENRDVAENHRPFLDIIAAVYNNEE